MTFEGFIESLRAVNAVLATITAACYAVRINNVWEKRTTGQRTTRLGFAALLCATAYGSAEAAIQQAAVGLRSVFVTAACTLVLLGLWRVRNDPQHDRWT